MLSRLLSVLATIAILAAMTVQAVAIEDSSMRRERQKREAQQYPNMANEALNKKDADLAIELYTKAINSGAFNSQPEMIGQLYFGRGAAYQMKKDCASAIKDFDKAAETISKGDLFYARGACHLELKLDDKALVDFDLAIKSDPQAPAYRTARCILLFNRRDFAGALPDCEKALLAAPDDKNLLLATSQAAEQAGNRQRAAELYRKLLTLDPGNPTASEGLKRTTGG